MNVSLNGGRVETPGHINSPGVQHSPAAEIATQQFKEYDIFQGMSAVTISETEQVIP